MRTNTATTARESERDNNEAKKINYNEKDIGAIFTPQLAGWLAPNPYRAPIHWEANDYPRLSRLIYTIYVSLSLSHSLHITMFPFNFFCWRISFHTKINRKHRSLYRFTHQTHLCGFSPLKEHKKNMNSLHFALEKKKPPILYLNIKKIISN